MHECLKRPCLYCAIVERDWSAVDAMSAAVAFPRDVWRAKALRSIARCEGDQLEVVSRVLDRMIGGEEAVRRVGQVVHMDPFLARRKWQQGQIARERWMEVARALGRYATGVKTAYRSEVTRDGVRLEALMGRVWRLSRRPEAEAPCVVKVVDRPWLERLPQSASIVDAHGVIAATNAMGCRALGYRPGELDHVRVEQIVATHSTDDVRREVRESMTGRATMLTRHRLKTGEAVARHLVITPVVFQGQSAMVGIATARY